MLARATIVIAAILLLVVAAAVPATADCPNVLPADPDKQEVIDCLNDFQRQVSAMREEITTLKSDLPRVDEARVAAIEADIDSVEKQIQKISAELEDGASAILAHNGKTDSDDTFEDTFQIANPGLLLVTGNGSVRYSGGDGANAGVLTTITVDGRPCASDRDFEGSTSRLTFFSSATCQSLLDPGTHTIKITIEPTPTNNRESLRILAKYVVLRQ